MELPRFRIRISRKKTMVLKTLLCFKIFNKQSFAYFLNIISVSSRLQDMSKMFLLLKWGMNSIFPSTVIEWIKIDKNIRKSESLNILRRYWKYISLLSSLSRQLKRKDDTLEYTQLYTQYFFLILIMTS